MKIFNQRALLIGIIALSLPLFTQAFISMYSPPSFAHTANLLNINGKDYWIWVGTTGHPAYLETKDGADTYIYTADPDDLYFSESKKAKPVKGMEDVLKFEVSVGGKNKTFDLQPVINSTGVEAGHYESPFIHTAEGIYKYRLFGDWNATKFDVTWSCTPYNHSTGQLTNKTVILSDQIVQKAESGSFSCPQHLESFPDPIISNLEIQSKLNNVTAR